MPFNINDPNPWIEEIVHGLEDPAKHALLTSLCKCLYWEDNLVKLPQRPLVGTSGMTEIGRIGFPDDITPEQAAYIVANTPPPWLSVPPEHSQRFNGLVAAEQVAAPDASLPWCHPAAAFRFAGGFIPQTPQGEPWVLWHLYRGLHPFPDKQSNGLQEINHFTQSAGIVAVHPLVHHLWTESPSIVHVLRARAFVTFGYDPDGFLSEDTPDNFGFVTH